MFVKLVSHSHGGFENESECILFYFYFFCFLDGFSRSLETFFESLKEVFFINSPIHSLPSFWEIIVLGLFSSWFRGFLPVLVIPIFLEKYAVMELIVPPCPPPPAIYMLES